jgi:hypothetical protein
MQITRVKKDTTSRLRDLLESYSKKGLDTKTHPVSIDSKGKIIDGAHRVALAIHSKSDGITCIVEPAERNITYDRQWFVDNAFEKELLEIMDETYSIFFNTIMQQKKTCK